jgi:hypothetical protein
VRNDTPAAIPLILLIAGLAIPLVHPTIAIAGLLLITLRFRPAIFAALGILLSLHLQSRDARERDAFAHIDPETFTTIEAPLERDWSPRDESFVLRASRFTANGAHFDTPIAVYARFEPREIAMEASLHAVGFLAATSAASSP